MPRPAAYPRAFQSGGVWPWTVNDGVTTRHVRFALTNRRRTTFHAAPGILRAFRQTVRAPAPPRRQRNPVYPWWDAKSMARDERPGICGDDFFGQCLNATCKLVFPISVATVAFVPPSASG
jgi:hypothetical protein